MPWFRVDDSAADHPKVHEAGNAAFGLWARCGAWSMKHLTDGYVPEWVARQYGTPSQIKRLVEVGLWARKDDGYVFHEWDQRQPSRARVEADRAAATARQARARARRDAARDGPDSVTR